MVRLKFNMHLHAPCMPRACPCSRRPTHALHPGARHDRHRRRAPQLLHQPVPPQPLGYAVWSRLGPPFPPAAAMLQCPAATGGNRPHDCVTRPHPTRAGVAAAPQRLTCRPYTPPLVRRPHGRHRPGRPQRGRPGAGRAPRPGRRRTWGGVLAARRGRARGVRRAVVGPPCCAAGRALLARGLEPRAPCYSWVEGRAAVASTLAHIAARAVLRGAAGRSAARLLRAEAPRAQGPT